MILSGKNAQNINEVEGGGKEMNKLVKRIKKILIGGTERTSQGKSERERPHYLCGSLQRNIALVKSYLGKTDDLVFRPIKINTIPERQGVIVYLETLVASTTLQDSVLNPLLMEIAEKNIALRELHKDRNKDSLWENIINAKINRRKDLESITNDILNGYGVIIIDSFNQALSVDVLKDPARITSEINTDKVVMGPQDGFVEDGKTNVWKLRRRIKSPNLVVKNKIVGKNAKNLLSIVYLDNIADLSIVEELFERLDKIEIDGVTGSGEIEELINDSPRNIFNTTFSTERPDRIATMVLDGRIAIIVDGTPFVIAIPAIISDFFISSDDYYQNYYFATANRLIGYVGAFIVLFLPSLYIAITSFHQELIPTPLALTIAGTRAGVPYPAFLEAFIMEFAFEALRQAGIRLPTHVGQAVSIVGALIIGQAAVEAGLVSPVVVIVVATTAIFSFTIPYSNFSHSIRILRFFNMILATILGIYGVMTGFLLIFLNLISLRSFGVNFMIPFAPLSPPDFKKWVFRFPRWSQTTRSKHIVRENFTKGSKSLRPQPSDERGDKDN